MSTRHNRSPDALRSAVLQLAQSGVLDAQRIVETLREHFPTLTPRSVGSLIGSLRKEGNLARSAPASKKGPTYTKYAPDVLANIRELVGTKERPGLTATAIHTKLGGVSVLKSKATFRDHCLRQGITFFRNGNTLVASRKKKTLPHEQCGGSATTLQSRVVSGRRRYLVSSVRLRNGLDVTTVLGTTLCIESLAPHLHATMRSWRQRNDVRSGKRVSGKKLEQTQSGHKRNLR